MIHETISCMACLLTRCTRLPLIMARVGDDHGDAYCDAVVRRAGDSWRPPGELSWRRCKGVGGRLSLRNHRCSWMKL